MSDFLQNFQNDLKENVNGFIAVSVTEVETGMSYCSLSLNPDFDPELASAYNLEVVKAKLSVTRTLNIKTDQIYILDVSEDGKYFIYLAVNSSKVNLGLTRATLAKFKKDIISKL